MSHKSFFKTSFILLSILFLGLILLSANLCYAQYFPYNQYGNWNLSGNWNLYGMYGYGSGYGMYGTGLGNYNIPITTRNMISNIDSMNYYMPFGYGTNSSSALFPFPMIGSTFMPGYGFGRAGIGFGGFAPFGMGYGGLGFGFGGLGFGGWF